MRITSENAHVRTSTKMKQRTNVDISATFRSQNITQRLTVIKYYYRIFATRNVQYGNRQ